MRVQAVAMDLESGVVQQLWCAQPGCRGGGASVMQTTYASEASPHLLVSQFVLNNTRGSSSVSMRVDPAAVQPETSRVGGGGAAVLGRLSHQKTAPAAAPLAAPLRPTCCG